MVADSTEGSALYVTIFCPTSNDATHTSLGSLARHFKEGKDGKRRLHFGPQLEDAESALNGLANVYLFVLAAAIDSFKIAQHESELTALHQEFKRVAKL